MLSLTINLGVFNRLTQKKVLEIENFKDINKVFKNY